MKNLKVQYKKPNKDIKFIELFGLLFELDSVRGIYKLSESYYDPIELIVLTEELFRFRYRNSMHLRGMFMKTLWVMDSFFTQCNI